MSGLVHLMSEHDWERVAASAPAGDLVTPPEGGFVHLSAPGQVAVAADRHFAGRRDLVLLVLDPARLSGLDLRWEEGDPPEGDLRFPHLYDPLPADAVVDARPYRPGPDGRFGDPPGRDVAGGS